MLLFGALSGASAEAVVYPMEVIRRRMQVQAASASSAGQPCNFWLVTSATGPSLYNLFCCSADAFVFLCIAVLTCLQGSFYFLLDKVSKLASSHMHMAILRAYLMLQGIMR